MTKTLSSHAHAAKLIRKELKAAFPAVLFSVRSRSFAGGDAIDVEWTNGPLSANVQKIVGKYEYGHFDGMCDSYEYSNVRNDIPQVKYVHTRRDYSDELFQRAFDYVTQTHVGMEHLKSLDDSCAKLLHDWSFWTAREYICSRIFSKLDLTNGLPENLQGVLC